MSEESPPAVPRDAASTEHAPSSLRAEFRAIFAVYVFSAMLPLLAGFACSDERTRRLAQRERAEQSQPAEEEGTNGRKPSNSGPQEG